MKIILPFISNTLMNFVIGLLLARFLGPAEYGRMALALAVGQVVQTLMFDWLRLAATRFYSERVRLERPELRATLDTSFAVLILALSAVTILFLLSGIEVPLTRPLVALAIGAAVANGLFDYNTALVRARFMDGLYARIIMGKNLLSLVLTVGGAWWSGSAVMALVGLCLSMTGSLLLSRHALTDGGLGPRAAERGLASQALRYALPIVMANMLYQVIPLIDRALIAQRFGFAESGQFSLAYDLGIRVVLAIGSTLDVLLFQIAVRCDETHGPAHSARQIGRNMGVVVAILAPTCVGAYLVLPSFQQLVVPPEFRGPFADFFTYLLPGFFCYPLIHYAVHPVFQIRKRTRPLIATASVAALANVGLSFAMPAGAGAIGYAVALSAALGSGLLALIGAASLVGASWPAPRDLAVTLLGSLAMAGAVLPLRGMAPGLLTLLVEVSTGALVYGAVAGAFDLAGLRSLALDHLPARWRRPVALPGVDHVA
ncbi:lipopolysaccharide biosynthesis protein [Lichenibacterium dinghuense]|uniref:lipopolysaccharide biosynthesis protein n=1 Tax=Lichenibacterium dinghuense TaxID=2895977 RepID=UPI001F27F8F8|nr:lipopolysaccharide biosynthesis protein [Lichenibacterium sp. 6Y81]